MPIFNFFRNLFGGSDNQPPPPHNGFEDQWYHGDSFRHPIWQNDDSDDGDDDFRHPGFHSHFRVFSDPFEMTRYFESQMDGILKNFFGLGHDGMMLPFAGKETMEALPPSTQPRSRGNLRDEFLKPGYENLKPDQPKLDVDLDGKLNAGDLSRAWKGEQSVEPYNSQSQLNLHSFGKSISTKIIRRSDGTMEQRRTVRDSDGNVETTVTRQIGDKMQTIVTKRDKDGVETQSLDLVNVDESELPEFEKKWTSTVEPSDEVKLSRNFPWLKFFGPTPKL